MSALSNAWGIIALQDKALRQLRWTKFWHLEVGMPLLTPAQSSLHKTITHVPMLLPLLHSCLLLHRGSFGLHQ
ncbi:unnamed protein product [Sphagnum jensenii]|uniref:Uncharacterized protein n=1 Tax=Sphagnum jensenii TaxID=128206 RepID=A0ABP1BIL4_9BRYO